MMALCFAIFPDHPVYLYGAMGGKTVYWLFLTIIFYVTGDSFLINTFLLLVVHTFIVSEQFWLQFLV